MEADLDVTLHAAGSWLDPVAQMVVALAWPTAAVIIAWMFRAQIADLIGKASKVKLGPWEIAFDALLQQVNVELSTATASGPKRGPASAPEPPDEPEPELVSPIGGGPAGPPIPPPEYSEAEREAFWQSIRDLPQRLQIYGAWQEVDARLQTYARETGLGHAPTFRTIEALLAGGRIPREFAASLHDLQRMRNLAVHAPDDLSADRASLYVELARSAADRLDTWVRNLRSSRP